MSSIDTARRDIHAETSYTSRNQAARIGAVERGELPSPNDAALDRAGELASLGRLAESRRVIELNYRPEGN